MGGGELLQLHMNGGNGEMSYANNSSVQKNIIIKAKSILEESISRMYWNSSSPKCIKVADLGCSVGPNALLVTSNIIDIVIDTTSKNLNHELPIFQIYLNDLFGNDFNTVFKFLPDFYRSLQEEKGHKFDSCFINAIPGSFYGRLFPNNSINLFHSSNSLHWLSQDKLLLELTNKEGEALNKGNCHIISSSSPPSVYKAYLKQFQEGFKLFLKSRSEELVPGGAMVLVLLGRDEKTHRTSIWEVVSLTLTDMLLEGLIEEEKLDTFNIPTYQPTMEEIKQVIEEEGSLCLQRLEMFTLPWDSGMNNEGCGDENTRAEFIAKYTRCTLEPLLSAQFGANIMKEFSLRLQKKILQLMEMEILEYPNLVISITKNA